MPRKKRKITIEDLFRLRTITAVDVSPDGERLAFAVQRQGHRHPGLELIQGVHGMIAAGANGQGGDEADPREPDGPLDPVQSTPAGRLVVDGLAELLQGAGRAGPAAPQPAHEKGRQEHQPKDDHATVDDALRGALQDEHGREIVERGGEEE